MDLIMQLNELGKRVDRCFPTINNGGCCVYAVMIAKELRKRKLRPKIVVANRDDYKLPNLVEVRKRIKRVANHEEWHANGIYFYHVGVEFTYKRKRYFYDTEGVVPAGAILNGCPIYPGRLRLDWAEKIAAHQGTWNKDFDRTQIPRLQKKVTAFFDTESNVFKRWLTRLLS